MLRKSAAVWVRVPGQRDRLVWALWPIRSRLAGSLLVAVGGDDQAVPGLLEAHEVVVTITRPGARTALAVLPAVPQVLLGEEREAADALLAAARRGATPAGAPPGWAEVVAVPLSVGG